MGAVLCKISEKNDSAFCLSSVKETETHKLWKNIEPHLKKAMQTVYLREVSRSELSFCFAPQMTSDLLP